MVRTLIDYSRIESLVSHRRDPGRYAPQNHATRCGGSHLRLRLPLDTMECLQFVSRGNGGVKRQYIVLQNPVVEEKVVRSAPKSRV